MSANLWDKFQQYYTEYPDIHLALDLSRMNFAPDFFPSMQARMQKAFADMATLEGGAIANPDEKRMVGHYWLRNPAIAPTPEIKMEIEETLSAIIAFAGKVHAGQVQGAGGAFKNLLVIGIGGSALGPQFVSHALGHPKTDRLRVYFFDNTDPDGMDLVLAELGAELNQTLSVVISKSGSTKETRNGMLEAAAAYQKAGLNFGKHAVAVTGKDSELDKYAVQNGWIQRFPMWDWVGGRTSELSAVGLLPAALQGIDVQQLLAGAKACDILTRKANVTENPSALISLAWYHSGNGKGEKNMVVLPYKDRLELFSKYLQQLIMESLGKESDLANNVVNQGIAVFGNKGATDQHSYIQQLRDGINNFFATFIEVLKERDGVSFFVEPDVTSGDYLSGFYQGTRRALYENGRESLTLTIDQVSPFSVGVLIALFERSVGLYASLVNINAYHQPGVEAGKKAAGNVIKVQHAILTFLKDNRGKKFTVADIATGIGMADEVETVFKIANRLAANPERGIGKVSGGTPFAAKFSIA